MPHGTDPEQSTDQHTATTYGTSIEPSVTAHTHITSRSLHQSTTPLTSYTVTMRVTRKYLNLNRLKTTLAENNTE